MSESAFFKEFSDTAIDKLMVVIEGQFQAAMAHIDPEDYKEFRQELLDTLAQACEDELL